MADSLYLGPERSGVRWLLDPSAPELAGLARAVQARTEGRASKFMETLVVFREKQSDGIWKHDYLLSNAWVTTPLQEFARVFNAAHRIEECLKRAKSEAGLADYQVRTWEGWHHHQTLALMASWFLTRETMDSPPSILTST